MAKCIDCDKEISDDKKWCEECATKAYGPPGSHNRKLTIEQMQAKLKEWSNEKRLERLKKEKPIAVPLPYTEDELKHIFS